MNLAEELELGPIAKWRRCVRWNRSLLSTRRSHAPLAPRFNIFPFKLVLHCLLIISLSALALVLNAEVRESSGGWSSAPRPHPALSRGRRRPISRE